MKGEMMIEDLKKLFTEPLTAEAFEKKVTEAGMKLADLKTGNYVDKSKYDADIAAVNKQLVAANSTIDDVNAKLKASNESLDKFKDTDLEDLKSKLSAYEQDKTRLEGEIARRDYASKLNGVISQVEFSSKAAKNQFLNDLTSKDFKFDGDTLLGYNDFLKNYQETDPTAFTDGGESDPKFTGSLKGKTKTVTAEEFGKMTTAEQIALKAEQPNLFKALIGSN